MAVPGAGLNHIIMTVLKADPKYRRRYSLLFCLIGLVMLCIALWGVDYLESLKDMEPAKAVLVLQVLSAALLIPLFPMSLYLYRFARKALVSGQFPPPGTKVLKDTEVVEGKRARRKGTLLLVASIVLAVIASVGVTYFPYAIGAMLNNGDLTDHSSRPVTPEAGLNLRALES